MSLHPKPIGDIPSETVRVARAAFPKGTVVTRLRDEFSALFDDEDFRRFYPSRGQPGLAPWRLALVTVFQFLEQLSDRQSADAVRSWIDWKYALGLELTDPGFHFSVLTEFRTRLVVGQAEHLLLDRMLERFKARGLVKARGKQRTDSTYVLAAVHDLHLLELVAETLRAALDDLAAVAPGWLRSVARPAWFERYERRVEDYRLPKRREEREALALQVGADGFVLLDALDGPEAPAEVREVAMVGTLRDVWRIHYAREGNGPPRWRAGAEQAYELRHFAIDWERKQVTCPQGKVSVTWRAGLDEVGALRIGAVFSRTDCGACAARSLCTSAKDARRSVYFHPRSEYEALNAARARMHDPAWKERYHVRAGIEGTLSQGVRVLGMRRSRYIGLARTGLQQACTAAAMNISRIVNWLDGRPRAKTRVTCFAALAQAA
jgi:transposase